MGAYTAMMLWALPISIVILSIFMQGGILTGTVNSSVNFCSGPQCAPAGSVTIITCAQFSPVPCKISPNCIPNVPAPAWCFPWPFSLVPTNAGTWLWAGDTEILTATQYNQGLTNSAAVFPINSIGVQGFIVIIVIAIAIAVIAGFNLFNSGIGPEAVHILWMGGMSIGIWLVLSAFDGFLTGSPNSLFAYLNGIVLSGTTAQIGTALWVICTVLWTLGTIALVSRGN